jgi:hypothetical protein
MAQCIMKIGKFLTRRVSSSPVSLILSLGSGAESAFRVFPEVELLGSEDRLVVMFRM